MSTINSFNDFPPKITDLKPGEMALSGIAALDIGV